MTYKATVIVPLILVFLIALVSWAFAHTGGVADFKCPVCGTKFKDTVTFSMTTFGSYRDFQKQGAIGTYYTEMIISCPSCHFAGYQGDFDKDVPAEIKEKVKKELKPINPGKALDNVTECEFAAKIYGWKKAKSSTIANITLVGSYLLRGAKGTENERRMKLQAETCRYLEDALQKGEIEEKQKAAVQYLIGELYRRQGKFDEAITWFNKSLEQKEIPNGLKDWIKEQKKLAEKKDDNNDI